MQENVSAADIEYLAKATFEECAKAFMKETIKLGIKSRPKGLWGYYLYPDCHNYNVYAPNYTGSCPEEEVLRNNELSWLWNSSAALYPSIGVRKSLGDSENVLRFSQFLVHESMRISTMTSHDDALPVFVYTRLGYRDQPLFFLSKKDTP
ncbi:Hyaluronidase-4, partial [Eschrichtius robustus]|nr:Hyaluronidase-4 [Eschrichtius robustus]